MSEEIESRGWGFEDSGEWGSGGLETGSGASTPWMNLRTEGKGVGSEEEF